MKKDFAIHVGGGLANKMFHLAFGISLKCQGKQVVYDDFSFIPEFEHDKITVSDIFLDLGLDRMPIGMYHYGATEGVKGKILRRLPFVTGEKYYITHDMGYDEKLMNSLKIPGYIIGPFQNEKYFADFRTEIIGAFSFQDFKDDKNQFFALKIKSEEAVAIHVRKGDGYATWKEFIGTCPVEYYQEAVRMLKSKKGNLKCYVFTDSPEWVKANFQWLDYTIVDWNPCVGYGNHFDMQLMSLCKHNIIANSTYSWWGAWLNNNPDKIVVAPKDWFNLNSRVKQQSEIVPESWIKI